MNEKQKHTPGPWYWNDRDEVFEVVKWPAHDRKLPNGWTQHAPDGRATIIGGGCQCEYGTPGIYFDNASDRALVQAAPDLLEALRSALFWLGKPEEDRLDDAAFQMFCDWARETVARAEGGDEQ